MIWLIIYLVGVLATLVFIPWATIKNRDVFYAVDLAVTICTALFSWLGLLTFLFIADDDIVIYRKKERK